MSRHHEAIKNDPRWKAARAATLERDGYSCVLCQAVDVAFQVDHVYDLALILRDHDGGRLPDDSLAFDLDNLRTLCVPCHQAKPTQSLVRNTWVNPAYPELLALVSCS
jgi:5-methylcytosine-specific restriction protein A